MNMRDLTVGELLDNLGSYGASQTTVHVTSLDHNAFAVVVRGKESSTLIKYLCAYIDALPSNEDQDEVAAPDEEIQAVTDGEPSIVH